MADRKNRVGKIAAWITVGSFLAGTVFAQGSLTPPGAPAPTMKTLDQISGQISAVSNQLSGGVESRIDVLSLPGHTGVKHTINAPGSYYLSGGISLAQSDSWAIEINADNVWLDLNGCHIQGAGYGTGIYVQQGHRNICIRNGMLSDMNRGVEATDSEAVIENLMMDTMTSYGILSQSGSRVMNCTIGHSGTGIAAGDEALIQNCRVESSTTTAILTGISSRIEGCTVDDCTGVSGIDADKGSTVSACNISYATLSGNALRIKGEALVERCNIQNSTALRGIYLQGGGIVQRCNVSNSSMNYGIETVTRAVIKDCLISKITGTGGLKSGGQSIIHQCSVQNTSNTNAPGSHLGFGMETGSGSTISDCNISYNKGSGIRANSYSRILNNNLSWNGSQGDGAGIEISGSRSHVEGNTLTQNKRGIETSAIASGNLIIGNRLMGNTTPFEIPYVNVVGGIYAPPTTSGISGSTGGTLIADDPYLNITY